MGDEESDEEPWVAPPRAATTNLRAQLGQIADSWERTKAAEQLTLQRKVAAAVTERDKANAAGRRSLYE